MSKKGFDLPRGSVYVAKPEDLCLVGGAAVLTGDERGPLDTTDVSHVLYSSTLKEAIDAASVANVDTYGVITPITIRSLVLPDGSKVPAVVAGRGRVRRARLANVLRRKRGEPEITIECRVERGDEAHAAGVMASEDAVRRRDLPLEVKVERVAAMQGRGMSLAAVATAFGTSEETVQSWLDYADHATTKLKRAVEAGKIAPAAACKLAKVADPAKQEAALEEVLAAGPGRKGTATVSAAKRAVRNAKAGDGEEREAARPGLRDVRKVLVASGEAHAELRDEAEKEFWRGAEAALKWVCGEPRTAAEFGKLARKACARKVE